METKEVIVLSPSKRGWRVSRLKMKMNGGAWESNFKGIRTVKAKEQAALFAKAVAEFEGTVFYQAMDSDRDVSNLSRELYNNYCKERGINGTARA